MGSGSSTRFGVMDSEFGTCFPNHVAHFVPLKVSYSTQINSKSNIFCVLKTFC